MKANFIPKVKPEITAKLTFKVKGEYGVMDDQVAGVTFKVLDKEQMKKAKSLDKAVANVFKELQGLSKSLAANTKKSKGKKAKHNEDDLKALSEEYTAAIDARFAFVIENVVGFANHIKDDEFEPADITDEELEMLYKVSDFKGALGHSFYSEQQVALRKN